MHTVREELDEVVLQVEHQHEVVEVDELDFIK